VEFVEDEHVDDIQAECRGEEVRTKAGADYERDGQDEWGEEVEERFVYLDCCYQYVDERNSCRNMIFFRVLTS